MSVSKRFAPLRRPRYPTETTGSPRLQRPELRKRKHDKKTTAPQNKGQRSLFPDSRSLPADAGNMHNTYTHVLPSHDGGVRDADKRGGDQEI